MKKILIAVVVILLALIGLTPWLDGYYFKQNYIALIDNINADNHVKITVLNYDLGWLHSRVTLQVSPVMQDVNTNPSDFMKTQMMAFGTITLDQTISHGPIVYDNIENKFTTAAAAIKNLIFLSSQIQATLVGSTSQPAAKIDSLACFDGYWTNRIETPVFNIPVKNAGKITWDGISGTIHFQVVDDRLVATKTDIRIGMLNAQGQSGTPAENTQILVQPVTITGQGQHQPVGLWNGTSNLNVPDIMVKNNSATKLEVQNFTMKSDGAVSADMYNAKVDLSVQKISIPDFVIPEFSQGTLDLAINNLNAQKLKELMDFMKAANQEGTPAAEFVKQYNSKLMTVLTPSMTVIIASSLNSSLGAASLNAAISWPANIPLPKSAEDLDNVIIKADVKIAVALARKIGEMAAMHMPPSAPNAAPANPVDQLVQQGYLVQQGNDYVSTITFTGGVPLINGKPPMPLTPPPAAMPANGSMPAMPGNTNPAMPGNANPARPRNMNPSMPSGGAAMPMPGNTSMPTPGNQPMPAVPSEPMPGSDNNPW